MFCCRMINKEVLVYAVLYFVRIPNNMDYSFLVHCFIEDKCKGESNNYILDGFCGVIRGVLFLC